MRHRLSAVVLAIAFVPSPALARQERSQELGIGVGGAVGVTANYPKSYRGDCGRAMAATPSLRMSYRLNPLIALEPTIAVHAPFDTETVVDCYFFFGNPGTSFVLRVYEPPDRGASVTPEVRLVLMPVTGRFSRFRFLVGSAWHVGLDTPSAFAGAGLRSPMSWGMWTVDLERWRSWVPYEITRITFGEPPHLDRELVGTDREAVLSWHLRVGFAVWVGN